MYSGLKTFELSIHSHVDIDEPLNRCQDFLQANSFCTKANWQGQCCCATDAKDALQVSQSVIHCLRQRSHIKDGSLVGGLSLQ